MVWRGWPDGWLWSLTLDSGRCLCRCRWTTCRSFSRLSGLTGPLSRGDRIRMQTVSFGRGCEAWPLGPPEQDWSPGVGGRSTLSGGSGRYRLHDTMGVFEHLSVNFGADPGWRCSEQDPRCVIDIEILYLSDQNATAVREGGAGRLSAVAQPGPGVRLASVDVRHPLCSGPESWRPLTPATTTRSASSTAPPPSRSPRWTATEGPLEPFSRTIPERRSE